MRNNRSREENEMIASSSYRKSIEESRQQIKQGKGYRLDLKTGKFRKVSTRLHLNYS